MSINLVCYTNMTCEEATYLNNQISQDILFLNNDFLIYTVDKYKESLEDIGIYVDGYQPKAYFLVYLSNKEKGDKLRYISNLIAETYKNNILILYENEIIWNNPLET